MAQDPQLSPNLHLYGGESGPQIEFASKGASHDLKGASHYLRHFLESSSSSPSSPSSKEGNTKLCVPMQAVIDYRGYRITAMPLLPLQALVYGSSDAGKTLNMSNPKVNQCMVQAASSLHLAGHLVRGHDDDGVGVGVGVDGGSGESKSKEEEEKEKEKKEIYSAADVEVHEGKDGRLYMLDLARTFPPQSPDACRHLPNHRGSIFFRMFRPEFLQIRKQLGFPPLSSDALSGFSSLVDGRNQSALVKEATSFLLDNWIPQFAKEIEGNLE